MPIFTILMVVVLVGSIGFYLLVMSRLFRYRRRYKFPEDKYTRLFRLLGIDHFVILYFLAVVSHLAFTVWLLWTL